MSQRSNHCLKGQPGDEVRGTCIYSMQNMGEPTCTFAVDRAKLHCIIPGFVPRLLNCLELVA